MAPIGPKTFELRSGLKLYLCAPAPPTPRPRTLREAIFERLSLCHVVADAVGFALILPRLHCPRFSSSPSCSSPSPSYPHRVFLVFVILVTGVVRITRHGLADARAPEGLALHARAPEGLAKPVRSPKPLKLSISPILKQNQNCTTTQIATTYSCYCFRSAQKLDPETCPTAPA